MAATVEVRFKGNRKDYFLWPDDAEPLRLRDPVIVPAERGVDLGRVTAVGEAATRKCASGCSGCAVGEVKVPEQAVIRRATREDVRQAEELRRSEEDTRRTIVEQVRTRQLEMKVSDAEWQWDRKKLTVYFTAEKRVDFRDLVRDLAAMLHARIDLRQIGARDEAARLSGVGRCGKEYCCSSWLTTLGPVSLALAKDQHLSLNPAQISGGCGRLLCCLKYEHEFYVTARKRFPKEGKTLRAARGPEKVVAVDIFRERVFLRSDEHGPRIVSLLELRDELSAAGEPPPEARGIAPRPDAQSSRAQRSDPDEIASGAPQPRDDGSSAPHPRDDSSAAPPPATTGEPERRRKRRRRRRRGPRPDGGAPPSSGPAGP
ncbi:MAG: stage 0 sporulation protein [Gemmatimonadetes bacterium]|nr:MAG: stage 0 sporulation protein [Gemmatimonadota bacterium]